ncbi:MAG: stage III sporulation protein AF [Dorea sp.]
MFEYLYEWIHNLAFYLVLVTAVLHMIPESGYKKYIQFFTGLILVLMIMTPVLKILGMDGKMLDIYHSMEYKQEVEMLKESGEGFKLQGIYEEESQKIGEIEVEGIQIGKED